MDPLEQAFKDTTRLLLGRELSSLKEFGPWLGADVPLPYAVPSKMSGKEVWMPPPDDFFGKRFDERNAISMEEGTLDPASPYTAADIEKADIASIRKRFIKPVATYWGNFRYKTVENAQCVSGCGDCVNVYMSEDVYHGARNLAYCKSVLYSENMFGCSLTNSSRWCLHCHNSLELSRCLEMDACTKCSDSLFCHNCENLENCMFCFNAKGLRYAIGNVEVGREKYMLIKKLVLVEISAKLEKTRAFAKTIYNVGCPL